MPKADRKATKSGLSADGWAPVSRAAMHDLVRSKDDKLDPVPQLILLHLAICQRSDVDELRITYDDLIDMVGIQDKVTLRRHVRTLVDRGYLAVSATRGQGIVVRVLWREEAIPQAPDAQGGKSSLRKSPGRKEGGTSLPDPASDPGARRESLLDKEADPPCDPTSLLSLSAAWSEPVEGSATRSAEAVPDEDTEEGMPPAPGVITPAMAASRRNLDAARAANAERPLVAGSQPPRRVRRPVLRDVAALIPPAAREHPEEDADHLHPQEQTVTEGDLPLAAADAARDAGGTEAAPALEVEEEASRRALALDTGSRAAAEVAATNGPSSPDLRERDPRATAAGDEQRQRWLATGTEGT